MIFFINKNKILNIMTNFALLKEFMRTFGQDLKDKSEFPNEKIIELRKKLIIGNLMN